MKKIMLFFVITLISLSGIAQTPSYPIDQTCPPGYCAHITWEIETLNFHKPRTGCKTGFGFCLKVGHGTVECLPCNVYKAATAPISNNKVTIFGKVVNNKLELHIPLALGNDSGFSTQDLSTFSIESGEQNIYKGSVFVGKMKGGEYPVKKTDLEYIVLIDIE
jgi:hypothetical protein